MIPESKLKELPKDIRKLLTDEDIHKYTSVSLFPRSSTYDSSKPIYRMEPVGMSGGTLYFTQKRYTNKPHALNMFNC